MSGGAYGPGPEKRTQAGKVRGSAKRPCRRLAGTPGSTENYLIPDWNSDAYLGRLQELITAIADRYHDDPTFAWVDVFSYGNWGEFHLYPFNQAGGPYDTSTQKPITDANAERVVKGAWHLSPALGGRIERAGFARGTPIDSWKRRVGYISPELQTDYAVNVTVSDLVASGRHASIGLSDAPTAAEKKNARYWLRYFALLSVAKRRPRELSYGQMRRALFARALAGDARILLLDEPLTGLDPRQRGAMKRLLERLMKRGLTLIVAAHHPEDLPRGITRVLRLHKRRAYATDLQSATQVSGKTPAPGNTRGSNFSLGIRNMLRAAATIAMTALALAACGSGGHHHAGQALHEHDDAPGDSDQNDRNHQDQAHPEMDLLQSVAEPVPGHRYSNPQKANTRWLRRPCASRWRPNRRRSSCP
jgi:ABC-type Mn2+/Zn2+ transport system ATPase subunit